jgi:hypothetical protein
MCVCGLSFDPTLQFQRSPCCDAVLTKKVLHYACSACGRIVPSRFLFDEKLFDQEYFRERMRLTRERRQRQDALMREMLRIARSDVLILLDDIALSALPGLSEDLDQLCGSTPFVVEAWRCDEAPTYEQYCRHISQYLSRAILFSAVAPLFSDERWDKVHRFAALIFMEHHREVNLDQVENDILVSRA